MKNCLITILTLITLGNCNGQDFELAGIRYLNYPTAKANNSDSSKFSIQEFGAFFNIPTILNKDSTNIIINGLGYGQVKVKSPAFAEGNINLHAINYRFSWIHKFNRKWTFIGVLEPTLASDFKSKLSSDDFVVQSMAMVTKRINTKFLIGGGLAYTTRFGYPLVMPVVPIKYQSKKHRINALLPIKLVYAYQLNDKLDIGVKGLVNGANFNITGYSNDLVEFNKVNYTRGNIGPVIYYKPKKIFTIEVSGGISTNRTFRLVDFNNNTYNNTASTEAFFNIGLVIKPSSSK